MNIESKRKKILIYIALAFTSILFLLFGLKSPIFRLILDREVNQIEIKYKLSINYSNAEVVGVNSIRIKNLNAISNIDSSSIYISEIKAGIPFRKLLRLNFKTLQIDIDSLNVNITQAGIDELSSEKTEDEIQTSNFTILPEGFRINPRKSNQIFKALAIFSDSNIRLKSAVINSSRFDQYLTVTTKDLNVINGNSFSNYVITENNLTKTIDIQTLTDQQTNELKVIISNELGNKVDIPLIDSILGLSCQFDTLGFSLRGESISRDSVIIESSIRINGLQAYHHKISDTTVIIDYADFKMNARVTPDNFKIDSTSLITVNSLTFPIYFAVNTKESTSVDISINVDSLSGKDLFESLPNGMFPNLNGIKVKGNTRFELSFHIDFEKPDSLNFYTKLTPIDFRILSIGKTDFNALNDTLTHKIYQNDSTTKSIRLHPDSKYYRTLENISPYLINAVVVAEDGGFYSHKGFDQEGFSYALIQNIKNKRLARGGSTITMQLVKNIYLNNKKNLARKAEEALIVWLIETQKLVNKDRILEIYLNIIEWGPEINGISEASEFYFNKQPHMIELNEVIFLASIIPRPNQFMYSFTKDGNLTDYQQGYYKFISEKLKERDQITDEEIEMLVPNVSLTGPAKLLLKQDTTSISINPFIELDDLKNNQQDNSNYIN